MALMPYFPSVDVLEFQQFLVDDLVRVGKNDPFRILDSFRRNSGFALNFSRFSSPIDFPACRVARGRRPSAHHRARGKRTGRRVEAESYFRGRAAVEGISLNRQIGR